MLLLLVSIPFLYVLFHENIKFPAVFSAKGNGCKMFLSSYFVGAVNVRVNVLFIVAASIDLAPQNNLCCGSMLFRIQHNLSTPA